VPELLPAGEARQAAKINKSKTMSLQEIVSELARLESEYRETAANNTEQGARNVARTAASDLEGLRKKIERSMQKYVVSISK